MELALAAAAFGLIASTLASMAEVFNGGIAASIRRIFSRKKNHELIILTKNNAILGQVKLDRLERVDPSEIEKLIRKVQEAKQKEAA